LAKLLPAADPRKSHQLKQALELFAQLRSQEPGARSQEFRSSGVQEFRNTPGDRVKI
jgi:hypothetical protein